MLGEGRRKPSNVQQVFWTWKPNHSFKKFPGKFQAQLYVHGVRKKSDNNWKDKSQIIIIIIIIIIIKMHFFSFISILFMFEDVMKIF